MLVEIDLNEAKRLELTINQFLLLKLLTDKVDIKPLADVIPVSDNDVNILKRRGILEEESILDKTFKKLVLKSIDNAEVTAKRDFFKEFYDMYPASTIRSDGVKDYLRGNPSRCRVIYEKQVGKSTKKHKEMLKALRKDLNHKMSSGSMPYMKRMYKWLTSEEWLLYQGEEEVKLGQENAYGTEIE